MTPKRGELTDNPATRDPLLTDDESEEELAAQDQRRSQKQRAIINRILDSSGSSSIFANDPDRTYCSELEAAGRVASEEKAQSVRKSNSEPLFNTDELNSHHSLSFKRSSAKTVEGEISDNELCSKMSEIRVREKNPLPSSRNAVRETVVGSFSDDSDEEQEQEPRKLRETVLHSSSDDDGSEEPELPMSRPIPRKKMIPKESLADTILGFSESMSELSIRIQEKAAPVPVPVPQQEEELDEDIESDYEVITVLDSEEEVDVSGMNDNDQPPVAGSNESFHNCSSINAKSLPKESTESDTTVNRFFNNPPSANPDLVVSHSIIQRHREQPIAAIPSPVKEIVSNVSADRFNVINANDNLNESDDDVELVETDTDESEPVHEIPQPEPPEDVESQHVVPSQRTRQSSSSSSSSENETVTQSTSNQTTFGNVNISAKFNINLKVNIRMRESSGSSSSEEDSSDSQPSPPPKQTPRKTPARQSPKVVTSNKKGDSVRKEKQTMKAGSATKTTPKIDEPKDDFHTPKKTAPVEVIDEDLQQILDNLYGESWKTPQLLRSCKSKSVRQDLRKSIHANNFEHCKFLYKLKSNVFL